MRLIKQGYTSTDGSVCIYCMNNRYFVTHKSFHGTILEHKEYSTMNDAELRWLQLTK